jgi:hypothetical protein
MNSAWIVHRGSETEAVLTVNLDLVGIRQWRPVISNALAFRVTDSEFAWDFSCEPHEKYLKPFVRETYDTS